MKSNVWSVGQVAEKFDIGTHVLRHWEDKGLLTPDRDSADRRRYDADDIRRVAVIQRSKVAGMSLDQIAGLLDSGAPGRHVLLHEHLDDIHERIAALELSREMTEHALRCRAHDITTCPGFKTRLASAIARRTLATMPSGSAPTRWW